MKTKYPCFFTNYLIWGAGFLKGAWSVIWDTELLLKYSNHALCYQQAQALVDLANAVGLKARTVDLGRKHAVMEAYYDDKWHMFDPDYEVIPMEGNRILSVNELAQNPALIEKLYKANPYTNEGKSMIGIITTKDIRHQNVNLCPRIYSAQRVLEIFKWIIPAFGIIYSSFYLAVVRSRNMNREVMCNE